MRETEILRNKQVFTYVAGRCVLLSAKNAEYSVSDAKFMAIVFVMQFLLLL